MFYEPIYDYLKKQFGMTGEQVMWPTFIVYGIAIAGSVFGGGMPMRFINKGMAVYKARMTTMFLISLLCVRSFAQAGQPQVRDVSGRDVEGE